MARVEATLKNVHFTTITDIFENSDNDYVKQQAQFVKDMKVIEKFDDNTKIAYMRSVMPIMSDREFLFM